MRKTLCMMTLGSLAVSVSLMGVEVEPMQVQAVKNAEVKQEKVETVEENNSYDNDMITDVFIVRDKNKDWASASSVTRYGVEYLLDSHYNVGDMVWVKYRNDSIYGERKLTGQDLDYHMETYKKNIYKYTEEGFLLGAKQL